MTQNKCEQNLVSIILKVIYIMAAQVKNNPKAKATEGYLSST